MLLVGWKYALIWNTPLLILQLILNYSIQQELTCFEHKPY